MHAELPEEYLLTEIIYLTKRLKHKFRDDVREKSIIIHFFQLKYFLPGPETRLDPVLPSEFIDFIGKGKNIIKVEPEEEKSI